MIVNGHKLQVELHGQADGPVVVLLHHGLGSVRAWKAQVPALVAAGWRVIVYDRWGYGGSAPRPGLTIPFFDDDLLDLRVLLDKLGVRQASLLGHSDGGTIALYFAVQHPDRVSCLVTVAAHIYVEPRMYMGIQGIRQSYEADARFRDVLGRVHGEKTEAVFWGWYEGWCKPENLNWDMRPVLGQLNCPVLVVQGQEDEHATPRHARHIVESIPNAELWLVPGVGHMLPQDVPDEFNRKMIRFIRHRTSDRCLSFSVLRF